MASCFSAPISPSSSSSTLWTAAPAVSTGRSATTIRRFVWWVTLLVLDTCLSQGFEHVRVCLCVVVASRSPAKTVVPSGHSLENSSLRAATQVISSSTSSGFLSAALTPCNAIICTWLCWPWILLLNRRTAARPFTSSRIPFNSMQ
eukprot:TRINITY_DN1570_c0_g1_i2.p1 TRINITY_DN1570_c0_g1~~TRINITY_DN1570_c0_g1_i2.p1  ORF type:complete len:146 (+),score=13.71 TRINITY_DN1570_c0_g1_i2:242-679(+)